MKSVPSENMLALRKLTEELSKENLNECKKLVGVINNIILNGYIAINEAKSHKSKIKYYENMCVTITDLLNEIK